jgi:hypothetical protein
MSAFDIKKLAEFFPKKIVASTGMAFCERSTASATSPHHIRKLTLSGMFPGGGADTLALCDAKVAWDTSEVESLFSLEKAQSNSHPSNQICQQCLHAARQLLEDA